MNIHDALAKPVDTTVLDLIPILEPNEHGDITEVGSKLVIEQSKPLPRKLPSLRRNHVVYDARTFASYVNKYGNDDTVILADPEESVIVAILDEKAGEGGRENVNLALQIHPRWLPWSVILGVRLKLDVLIKVCRVNRDTIYDGKQLVFALSQIRSSVEITKYDGKGRTALNGMLIKTKIEGARGEDIVELPETIVLDTAMYLGTEGRRIELQLVLEVNADEGVTAQLFCGEAEVVRFAIFEKLVTDIREALTLEDAIVGLGEPRFRSWLEQ